MLHFAHQSAHQWIIQISFCYLYIWIPEYCNLNTRSVRYIMDQATYCITVIKYHHYSLCMNFEEFQIWFFRKLRLEKVSCIISLCPTPESDRLGTGQWRLKVPQVVHWNLPRWQPGGCGNITCLSECFVPWLPSYHLLYLQGILSQPNC